MNLRQIHQYSDGDNALSYLSEITTSCHRRKDLSLVLALLAYEGIHNNQYSRVRAQFCLLTNKAND